VVATLDLGSLIELKTWLSRASFSNLTIYLEVVVTLVLVTQGIVLPATVIVAGPLIGAQAIVIRRSVRQLIDGWLARSYWKHLLLSSAR